MFRGGPAERRSPDSARWRVTAPPAGSTGALVVDFAKPMNYPLLTSMLRVTDARGQDVPGMVSIAAHETEWRFAPRTPWKAGDYRLVADTRLEDLAGNRIGQLFDIDTFERVTDHIATRTVSVAFTVRSFSGAAGR
jgi:hypothetical protein